MSTFSESASARLSVLLGRPVTGKVITAQHRAVIGQVCDDAKAAGMSIERIIISLKAMFDKIPPSDGNTHARSEIRERVIAICIEEYYRDGSSVPTHHGDGATGNGKYLAASDGKGAAADGKYLAASDGKSPPTGGGNSRSAPPPATVPLTV